jgi:hypothetical protein
MARKKEENEKRLVFKIDGYVQTTVDLNEYDGDEEAAVEAVKNEIEDGIGLAGFGDTAFTGTVELQAGKRILTETRLVDEDY